jgi:hypothetical protein
VAKEIAGTDPDRGKECLLCMIGLTIGKIDFILHRQVHFAALDCMPQPVNFT